MLKRGSRGATLARKEVYGKKRQGKELLGLENTGFDEQRRRKEALPIMSGERCGNAVVEIVARKYYERPALAYQIRTKWRDIVEAWK